MRKTLATTVLFALALTGLACEFHYSTVRIAEAQLARAVNAQKEAVNPTTTFDTNDQVIHAVVQLANAPADTKVKARWLVVKVEGAEDNQLIAETEMGPLGDKNQLDFTLTPTGKGLPPGAYKAEIYLNPTNDQPAPPDRTLNFTVEAARSSRERAGTY
jgi:hypothetical protein